MADFETSTWLDDESYVWAWGIMHIESHYMQAGSDIESFVDALKTMPYRACMWFHNLKFDGQFIIHELFKQGYVFTDERKLVNMPDKSFHALIGDTGAYYNINIKSGKYKYVEIYDSSKKMAMELAMIGKKLGIEDKGEIDYNKIRDKGGKLAKEDYEYLYTDCLIGAKALKSVFFDKGYFNMTMGSDAMTDFKRRCPAFKHLFPLLEKEVDAFARKSYKGGFVWKHPRADKHTNGCTLDVNAMYSSMEHSCSGNRFPIGQPIYGTGMAVTDEHYNLFIQHFRAVIRLKDDHIPTIQIKGGRFADNEYITNSNGEYVELWLTDVDLKLMFDHYKVDMIDYIDYQLYQSAIGLFDEYVNFWQAEKTRCREIGDAAGEMLAKNMLNNLYGKFGLSIDSGTKIPYIGEDGLLHYELVPGERKPVYVPVASWNTAYARNFLIRRAQMNYEHYLYSDTDANHYDCEPERIVGHEIDKYKLCCWKIESRWSEAIYIRQKTYGEKDCETGKWTWKCAGLGRKRRHLLTPENFKVGYYDSEGKLRPKRVKGGVNLVPVSFEIKG